MNSRYQVIVRCWGDEDSTGVKGLVWLSIRNIENTHERDWRDYQRIKNELVGPEREGCELYPAESRLADGSNQFHMFVLPEGVTFPFGFPDRLVSEIPMKGGCQRPFEDDAKPADLITQDELERRAAEYTQKA